MKWIKDEEERGRIKAKVRREKGRGKEWRMKRKEGRKKHIKKETKDRKIRRKNK